MTTVLFKAGGWHCSDIRSNKVYVFTYNPKFDKRAWAVAVLKILLLARTDLFQRHRWCNSSLIDNILIFNFFNIGGGRAVPRWHLKLKGKKVAPFTVSVEWEVSESESDLEPEQDLNRRAGDREEVTDWVKWNKKQRRSAVNYAKSDPRGKLVVGRITLGPQVSLLHILEFLLGTEFEEIQLQKFITDRSFTTMLKELVNGELFELHSCEVLELMDTAEKWTALDPAYQTQEYSSLAFGMLSRAACGVDQLLFSQTKRLPLMLVHCLDSDEGIGRVTRIPFCQRDNYFGTLLLKYYGRYKTRKFKLVLFQRLIRLYMSIGQIECRHAAIRKWSKSSSTWAMGFPYLSATFLLMRQRIMQSLGLKKFAPAKAPKKRSGPQKKTKPGKPKPQKTRQKARRRQKKQVSKKRTTPHKTAGAGPHRAFLRRFLRSKQMKSKAQRETVFNDANEAYRLLKRSGGPGWEELVQEGAAGLISHQHGMDSFGPKASKCAKRAQGDATSDPPVPAPTPEPELVADPADPSSAVAVNASIVGYNMETTITEYQNQAQVVGLAALKEKLRAREEDNSKRRKEIDEWQAQQTDVADPVGFDVGTLVERGPSLPNLDYIRLCPPSQEVAEKALSTTSASGPENELRKLAKKFWNERCNGVRHRDIKPLVPRRKAEVKACYFAGFCMCRTHNGKMVNAISAALRAMTRKLLAKGSGPRSLYKDAKLAHSPCLLYDGVA